jgi:hypothetical protein
VVKSRWQTLSTSRLLRKHGEVCCGLVSTISNIRTENPLCRVPFTLLIDDGAPGINPLYYFASQVPAGSVDYHYVNFEGKWFFEYDTDFRHPIVERIDEAFVDELSSWIQSTNVKGKISVIPFPAGLGRVDEHVQGVRDDQLKHFLTRIGENISRKMDVTSELLTHTNALDLETFRLKNVSEHDWSQIQSAETLTNYIALSLRILKQAGLNPSGVTSPCNFGEKVEADYAEAVLNATKRELGSKVAWYFLRVDKDSNFIRHEPVHLDPLKGEATVSIVACFGDPFWSSQVTDQPKNEWIETCLGDFMPQSGRGGRIEKLVLSGSHVAIVTHWQSLYSSGKLYGLEGLKELVNRINSVFGEKITWAKCSELASYIVSTSCARFRVLGNNKIGLFTPFNCSNFTFSFEVDSVPSRITVNEQELGRVERRESLTCNSWFIEQRRVFVCIAKVEVSEEKEETVITLE